MNLRILAIIFSSGLSVFAQENTLPPIIYKGLEFPELPFSSNFIAVVPDGLPVSKMHYLEAGDPDQDVMLLIHGQPTWSYLWRNVITHLQPHARVIAVDLIGMGKSGKPDITYNFVQHAAYLDSFIEVLELKDITLVIHDWGSGLGFDYAFRNQDNVRAIAFMEAILGPVSSFDELGPEFDWLRTYRTPNLSESLLMDQNEFVEHMLQKMMFHKLDEEELNAYRVPYPTPAERLPIHRWPNEIPIGGQPTDTFERVAAYSTWLFETDKPMLQLYASPGLIITPEAAIFFDQALKNVTTTYIGNGLHFVQEDQPQAIGAAIATWYQGLP